MVIILYAAPTRPSTPAHWMAGFVLVIISSVICACVAFYYGFTTEVTPKNAEALARLRTIGLGFTGLTAAVVLVWLGCRKWLW